MRHLFLAILLVLTSCSNDDNTSIDYKNQNDEEIKSYIETNNLTATKTESGLYYVIDNPGEGEAPTLADRVKVKYKGYLTDGSVFDENQEGYSVWLQSTIIGWAEGISKFKEGGSGKLLIPAHLGYGSNNNNAIPGGSVLIFDIELIYVNYKTENDLEIQNYLANNNITATKTDSGLYYTINTPGSGLQPTENDNVTIDYKGYFTDGTVFNELTADISLDIRTLIEGFAEGITYFNEGAKGSLIIPSHLAYGNTGTPSIPEGAVLIFDIELKSIN
ncbi:FKBP-type peptidyl-prolyl cis-trans isomerase [Cognatitamlana onchidii]|uniref:FKBP-type peptidyl-prolyl cis-trans isomerase n=1 Tax=Cognatitamlana onchidii TaxID=2562860 RepID=UPI0010A613C5|nr:FKBP-type peptidyl-prolyl cis-trans isomerase [Algibacter onchidii]